MPPKKANKAPEKAPPRKPAAKKPGPKPKPAAKPAPLAKNTKKRKSSEHDSEPRWPTPEWDKNITTQSQREKKRYKISMKSQEIITEEDIANLASKLKGGSRNTWGVTSNEPIKAGRRPTTRHRPHLRHFDIAERNYMSMMDAMRPQARKPIPNDPARSPILRIPLEIREKIYSYFFKSAKPILVKPDWTTVEHAGFDDISLLFVCKKFAHEAAAFIFRNNTILSALLPAPTNQFRRFDEPSSISPEFLSLFRNITIDCSNDCWNLDWYEIATVGLNKLVDAKACIKNLKLVFVPKCVGISSTALGMEVDPVTFADFLWYEGDFMGAIRKLAPKTLTVVIKKKGQKKLFIDVDMTYLHAGELEAGPLANEETLRVAQEKAVAVKTELLGLKNRYEEIYENHWKAFVDGQCRLFSNNAVCAGSGVGDESQSSSRD